MGPARQEQARQFLYSGSPRGDLAPAISAFTRRGDFASTTSPHNMAPTKAKTNDSNMKQKSLMSFFGKPATDKSTQKPAPKASGKPSTASNASKAQKPSTPESKGSDIPAPTSSAGASSGGESSVKQTPPTSDPVDVDMLFEEEIVKERVQAKAVSTFILDVLCYLNDALCRLALNVKSLSMTQTTKMGCLSRPNQAIQRHLPSLLLPRVSPSKIIFLFVLITPVRPGEETTRLCPVCGRE